MTKFSFVSHDSFPDDEYTKELVYLEILVPQRVAYVRKKATQGGMFWSVASVGASRNGKKEFFPAAMQDSNFLEKEIKKFLDDRVWEKGQQSAFVNSSLPHSPTPNYEKPHSMDEVASQDELPF